MSISEYMTQDHRHCDELYSQAEQAVDQGDWGAAQPLTEQFLAAMARHLQREEETLFPAFEQRTGMTMGPTAVMRSEHQQMRDLFSELRQALQQRSADDFLGAGETLFLLIQQHNMKEEGMLYPMTDQQLADQSEQLIKQMAQQ